MHIKGSNENVINVKIKIVYPWEYSIIKCGSARLDIILFCENEKKIATVIFRLIYFKRLLIVGSENLED